MFSLIHPDKVFKRETPKVRTDHECFKCLATIQAGTKAVAVSSRYDGKLYKVFLHPTCEGSEWLAITQSASEEPPVEVLCMNDAKYKAFGWLKYSPEFDWYCETKVGTLYGITHYQYVNTQENEI